MRTEVIGIYIGRAPYRFAPTECLKYPNKSFGYECVCMNKAWLYLCINIWFCARHLIFMYKRLMRF